MPGTTPGNCIVVTHADPCGLDRNDTATGARSIADEEHPDVSGPAQPRHLDDVTREELSRLWPALAEATWRPWRPKPGDLATSDEPSTPSRRSPQRRRAPFDRRPPGEVPNDNTERFDCGHGVRARTAWRYLSIRARPDGPRRLHAGVDVPGRRSARTRVLAIASGTNGTSRTVAGSPAARSRTRVERTRGANGDRSATAAALGRGREQADHGADDDEVLDRSGSSGRGRRARTIDEHFEVSRGCLRNSGNECPGSLCQRVRTVVTSPSAT